MTQAVEPSATTAGRPGATYRLQFHGGFTFRDAVQVVPYLAELGVTHVYASPYLRARAGSTHGYDVVGHGELNPEVGTDGEFEAFVAALHGHGMGQVLDIVPNHMGVATNDNTCWNDVLMHGAASRYAEWFDIDWDRGPRPEMRGKVLLPVLGDVYGNVLDRGELKVAWENGALVVCYHDRQFPIDPDSAAGLSEQDVEAINGDRRRLHELLEKQHYRLAHWRTAADEINYRRFFDINDLAALRMEREDVFEATHERILGWLEDGMIDGLRIDHPDGLYDPKQYLARLRARRPGVYVVVEKILALGEELPRDWPADGTSGYDALNQINGLFVDRAGAEAFDRLYQGFTGCEASYADLAYLNKLRVMEVSLSGELNTLARQLDELAQRDTHTRDFTLAGLWRAMGQVVACFPVYRTYVSDEGVRAEDRAVIERAVGEALRRNPKAAAPAYHFIRDTLLLEGPAPREGHARFAGKFQQLTAPVTAKGIEDTTFYQYNRLVSLNEVGGEPGCFGLGVDEVHGYLRDRQAHGPGGLTALSTHDTKRSEDVRARINVLSEIPQEWAQRVSRWAEINAPHRALVSGRAAPDRNEEYLLYQTLVGAWPVEGLAPTGRGELVQRIVAYMEKALREAKVHTSWTDPEAEYERAVGRFVERLLDDGTGGGFLRDFEPFQRRVSHFGLLNSLSQTLLRLTVPGVPDTYQGTELWDFSLVDPDNRRPVDYAKRREILRELKVRADGDRAGLARELVRAKEDGRVKLYVTWQSLMLRRRHPRLFDRGTYEAVKVDGAHAQSVFAFVRRERAMTALVVVPRLMTRLVGDGGLPVGADVWGDTKLDVRPMRGREVLTGQTVDLPGRPGVGLLLSGFPVAVWVSQPG